ncbi:glycosyltransferase family 2 protein [Mycoplasmoides alvi]|uniref:glycosyltransferase family 2 protein n=1 Tax=Mycoplasmoides alvi TaxID=78580 RepID=UPI000696C713|nr:glycosyltransferase family 2 protein [Mycoplasmoides alvi]
MANLKINNFDITVIVPTYNCCDYLPFALNSIINQNIVFNKIEVIVVDDGSTDETEIVMQNYLHHYSSNIFYYKKTNGNWGSVINFVKKNNLAHGKLITILDSDDYFFEDAFSKVLPYIDYDMIVSSFDCFIDDDKKYVLNPFFGKSRQINNKKKLRTPHSQPICKFYSNELFYSLDDLLENMWYQDCILYHQAVSKSKSVYYIRESLGTWFSTRPGNSTTTPWTNDAKFNAWCETLKNMCLNDAGVVVYVYSLLPGFLDQLKKKSQVINLPTKPSHTWLPFLFAWVFNWVLYLKIHKWIKYPKKNFLNNRQLKLLRE